MTDAMTAWHAEHAYFRQLLDLLHKQVDLFHTGDRPNYELMLDIVSYLQEYSDKVHHPREDAAYARLAKRRPDIELTLARFGQEHRVIAHAGKNLLNLLNQILGGALMQRAEVEVAAATYLVYYRNHIAKEEEDFVSRAAQALTAEDWEAVRNAVPGKSRDPLFGDRPEERYRELRRQIARETLPET
ncbi:MAG TPA: hemerythrin domain-containing protein [Burkholderiales bacterium]|jgi:hemerythrin-like domain-containing protein|nr:hemerythrin domain-containing protein [Burkholderiales bacterium]